MFCYKGTTIHDRGQNQDRGDLLIRFIYIMFPQIHGMMIIRHDALFIYLFIFNFSISLPEIRYNYVLCYY